MANLYWHAWIWNRSLPHGSNGKMQKIKNSHFHPYCLAFRFLKFLDMPIFDQISGFSNTESFFLLDNCDVARLLNVHLNVLTVLYYVMQLLNVPFVAFFHLTSQSLHSPTSYFPFLHLHHNSFKIKSIGFVLESYLRTKPLWYNMRCKNN